MQVKVAKSVGDQETLVANYFTMKKCVDIGLKTYGPKLVHEATQKMSMRAFSKRVGLSIGYLSMVASGKTVISKKAYLRIAKELRGCLR
jgi:hypothetical protein